MSNISAPRDNNRIPTLIGTSSSDGTTPVTVYVDPTTHRMLVDNTGSAGTVTSITGSTGILLTPDPITTTGTVALATALQPMATLTGNSLKYLRVNVGETALEYAAVAASGLTIGTTTITSGTTTRVLYDNAGVLGEYTITGTGSVVMGTTPTIATPVINGLATGTGVASAATASTLVARDSNANIYINNHFSNLTSVVSASGTTTLTIASSRNQVLTGTLSQTFQLPDATTLTASHVFTFNNNSSGSLIINNAGAVAQYTVPAGGYVEAFVTDTSTANGVWDFHALPPKTVTWSSGTSGLIFNTALTTTPSINSGASSSTSPSFIPQRGSATTGFGGDSSNLYGIIGAVASFTSSATGFNIPTGSTYQINGTQIAASNLSNGTVGSGNIVLATSPTLVTPILGVATATSINKVTITAPATSATLTIANGKTLTANNSITLAGTDSTTMTFPSTSKTILANDLSNIGTAVANLIFTDNTYDIGASGATRPRTGYFATSIVVPQIINANNAITATANAATVPITSRISTVTNNSAATLTITITTTSAVDGQMVMVRILDFSAVAQTVTWVNTENSTVSAPTTSNGSTTLPLTVGFQYNANTSKWRCIASA